MMLPNRAPVVCCSLCSTPSLACTSTCWPISSTPTSIPSPMLWRFPFPKHIQNQLATSTYLELTGSVLHHKAAAQCFDLRKRTLCRKTDNLSTLFWALKGSAMTTKASAHLLRMHSLHQRFHHCVPLHNYLPGSLKTMADDASLYWHLHDRALFIHNFNSTYSLSRS